MAETPKLTGAELSAVWKDKGNVRPSGLKLDLVEHLKGQRKIPEWVELKQKAIQLIGIESRTTALTVLDVGCGIGLDLLEIAKELKKFNKTGKLIGLDFNTEMISYSTNLFSSEAKSEIPSDLEFQFIKEDCTDMKSIASDSIDVVKCDITLMHTDSTKTLKEIRRVLKPGGLFLSLDGGGGGSFYCADSFVEKMYHKCLPPPPADGGIGVQLWFNLPALGFHQCEVFSRSIINTNPGESDPGWIKLKGLGEMLVERKIISAEESSEYTTRYIAACEQKKVMSTAFVFLHKAVKV